MRGTELLMNTRGGAVMKRWAGTAGLLLALAAGPAAGQDFLVGARPLGMGGAYAAQEGDVNCVPWNPAGLATVNTIQFTSMYADLYQLGFLKESNFSFAVPLGQDRGVAALGYSSLAIDFDYPSYFNLNTLTWRDSEFRLSYARPLTRTVNLGGTVNWLSTTSNVQGGQMKGYSFDFGATMLVMPELTLGASLTDLLSHRKWDGGGDAEVLGIGYRVGALYRFNFGLRTAMDFYGNSKSDDSLDGIAFGLEYPLYYKAPEETNEGALREYMREYRLAKSEATA